MRLVNMRFSIIVFLCFIFLLDTNAQSKRKLRKQAKELEKHIAKLDLEIIVRGLDLTKVFVVQNKLGVSGLAIVADPKLEEASWNTALFKNGLDVGDYSIEKQVKDANNREMQLSKKINVRGDYLMEIYRDRVKIVDVNNNNKIVATLTFHLNTLKYREKLIDHIISEMIEEAK